MVIWLALNQEEEFHNALSRPAKSSLTLKHLCPLCSTTSVDGAIPWIVTTSSWYAEGPDNVCKTMTILRCLRRWTALQKTQKQRQFVLQHKATCKVCARVLSGRVSRGSPFQLAFLKIVLPCSKFALLLPVWPSAELVKSSAPGS